MANAASEIINEEWRAVVGYEGYYEVSNWGRIRRIKPKILRPARGGGGYPYVALYREGVATSRRIHRMVVEAFIGPIPDTLHVNHRNGAKDDNRAENLEIVTRSQNMIHRYHVLGQRGTRNLGEANGASKLTEADVTAIRERWASGERQVDLGREFGIHRKYIAEIVHRRAWKHLP